MTMRIRPVNGKYRIQSANGVRCDASCEDAAAGGTRKDILQRLARGNVSTGTTTDLEVFPSTHLPGGSWVGRVVCQWGAYDTVDNTIAGGRRIATVKCVAGTVTVETTGANQLAGSTDDNTMAAAMTTGSTMLIRTTGNNLHMRFITLKTDLIHFWAHMQIALVAH